MYAFLPHILLGHVCFLVLLNVYFQISFPKLLLQKSILLSVDTARHMKADLESEVAKAAIKLRNTFIAAETMIGRGLSFLIFVLFSGFKEIFT